MSDRIVEIQKRRAELNKRKGDIELSLLRLKNELDTETYNDTEYRGALNHRAAYVKKLNGVEQELAALKIELAQISADGRLKEDEVKPQRYFPSQLELHYLAILSSTDYNACIPYEAVAHEAVKSVNMFNEKYNQKPVVKE